MADHTGSIYHLALAKGLSTRGPPLVLVDELLLEEEELELELVLPLDELEDELLELELELEEELELLDDELELEVDEPQSLTMPPEPPF